MSDMYRKALSRSIKCVCKGSNPVVVDLGAYKGAVVEKVLNKNSTAKVYCVEPDKKYYESLKKKHLSDSRVVIQRCVIADENREYDLLVSKSHLSNSIYKGHATHKDSLLVEKVPGMTMSAFMDYHRIEHVDLMKINIEGGEYAMFKETAWLNRVDTILMQLHCNDPFYTEEYHNIRKDMYLNLTNAKFCPVVAAHYKFVKKKKYNWIWSKDAYFMSSW